MYVARKRCTCQARVAIVANAMCLVRCTSSGICARYAPACRDSPQRMKDRPERRSTGAIGPGTGARRFARGRLSISGIAAMGPSCPQTACSHAVTGVIGQGRWSFRGDEQEANPGAVCRARPITGRHRTTRTPRWNYSQTAGYQMVIRGRHCARRARGHSNTAIAARHQITWTRCAAGATGTPPRA
jgi:hypothetical protein